MCCTTPCASSCPMTVSDPVNPWNTSPSPVAEHHALAVPERVCRSRRRSARSRRAGPPASSRELRWNAASSISNVAPSPSKASFTAVSSTGPSSSPRTTAPGSCCVLPASLIVRFGASESWATRSPFSSIDRSMRARNGGRPAVSVCRAAAAALGKRPRLGQAREQVGGDHSMTFSGFCAAHVATLRRGADVRTAHPWA